MGETRLSRFLDEIYQRLLAAYGHQHWWPANGSFEVMVGAILTQSAAWSNVNKAIGNLKKAGALSPQAIRSLPLAELALIIRPCGYFNAKAVKLKALADWFGSHGDNIESLHDADIESLRRELLAVHGVGQETADSILLYAVGKPVFVIDAYTRRIIGRLGLLPEKESYGVYQRLFTANLEADVHLYNEYHALLVKLAKDACRKKPLCLQCCLSDMCCYNKNNNIGV
ncbi:MAG TPA: endonuclease III domain-containing protein [Dehalococcoidia bacterium]|nr:endonuclease III domain-containing protein [Dehalococcoidia bacterium]